MEKGKDNRRKQLKRKNEDYSSDFNGPSLVAPALRLYQVRIRDVAVNQNSLVVLPTGAGKTRIAAEVADIILNQSSKAVLFLVPTCLLVEQQASSIRSTTGRKVAEFMGSRQPPGGDFNILVSTPESFLRLSISMPSKFGFHCFCFIVFDEVHHVVKRHPYRKIARLLNVASLHRPQVMGLTASVTYAMGESQIKKAVEDMCTELSITCVLTATKEELRAGGYHAGDVAPILASSHSSTLDNNDSIAGIDVDIYSEASGMPAPLPGRVHEGLPDFLRAIELRDARLHPLAVAIMDAVRRMELRISQMDSSFASPIGVKGKHGRVAEWGELAYRKGSKCDKASPLAAAYLVLEHLYEALRLIINSRQTAIELAMQYLEMMATINPATATPSSSSPLDDLTQLWIRDQVQFRRLAELKAALLEQKRRFGSSLRCIVFSQQRVTTHILKYFIDNDSDLGDLSSDVIYAASSPATARLSVTSTQAQARLKQFANGQLSLLFSTAVAEEGMDIPEANCVIRFDPVQTPVSLVQSRGRARKEASAFIVMQEQKGRSVAELAAAEQQQVKALQSIDLDNADDIAAKLAARNRAHQSRLISAQTKLRERMRMQLKGDVSNVGDLALVKQFANWTQSEVNEQFVHKADGWSCHMKLLQPWMEEGGIAVESCATTKKDASRVAASILLRKICP